MPPRASRPHHPRRIAVLALAFAVVAFPLGALASHDFGDVPDSNPFHADISALVASGVTSGCGGGNYCPSANVTREQMAAFLNRLGALAPGKTPVVNADRLDGLDSSDFLQSSDIVTQYFGPWRAFGAGNSVVHGFDEEQLSSTSVGTADYSLALSGPASIGAVNYGFASVEVCFHGSVNADIITTYVYEIDDNATELVVNFDDFAAAGYGCYSATDATPTVVNGAVVLVVVVQFTAAGLMSMEAVRATWTPV